MAIQKVKGHRRAGMWVNAYHRRRRPILTQTKPRFNIKPSGILVDRYGRIMGRVSTKKK